MILLSHHGAKRKADRQPGRHPQPPFSSPPSCHDHAGSWHLPGPRVLRLGEGGGGGLEFSPTRGFPPEGEGLHTGGGGPGKAQAATPAPFATWTSSLRTPTGSSSRCPAAGIQPPFPGNPSRSFTERVRFADPPHLLVAGPRKVVCCLSHL